MKPASRLAISGKGAAPFDLAGEMAKARDVSERKSDTTAYRQRQGSPVMTYPPCRDRCLYGPRVGRDGDPWLTLISRQQRRVPPRRGGLPRAQSNHLGGSASPSCLAAPQNGLSRRGPLPCMSDLRRWLVEDLWTCNATRFKGHEHRPAVPLDHSTLRGFGQGDGTLPRLGVLFWGAMSMYTRIAAACVVLAMASSPQSESGVL